MEISATRSGGFAFGFIGEVYICVSGESEVPDSEWEELTTIVCARAARNDRPVRGMLNVAAKRFPTAAQRRLIAKTRGALPALEHMALLSESTMVRTAAKTLALLVPGRLSIGVFRPTSYKDAIAWLAQSCECDVRAMRFALFRLAAVVDLPEHILSESADRQRVRNRSA